MIPVCYQSYNVARQPLLFGDQVMMKDIFDSHAEFYITTGINNRFDGAVVTMPLHQNELYIDNLNADLSKLKWVLLILTANEFGSDAYKDIKHPNMKIWLQTPKQSDEADRFLPLGYPTEIKPKRVKKKYQWFFSGQITNPVREQCVEVLRELKDGKLIETAGFWQGVEHSEYIKLMAQSRVIPCPSGPATPDTFRLYEALELGCIPIVDSSWYWYKLFGMPPFPILENWNNLPIVMSTIQNNERFAKTIFDWWGNFKDELIKNLFADIKELENKA